MIIICDFDGTLALGNPSHITLAQPNLPLIERLRKAKKDIGAYIKITTARGAKRGLSNEEKIKTYKPLIEQFLTKWNVPYDEISFNKEYGDVYIDDMTIHQDELFETFTSPFTRNKIMITENSVIKKTSTSLFEREWYDIASIKGYSTPDVLFCNDETIITKRIKMGEKPHPEDIINIVTRFKNDRIKNPPHFQTYINNIIIPDEATDKVREIINNLPLEDPTFFHGDLSTTNVLKTAEDVYLIDPNYKGVFGNWKTDAGKAIFSFVAYERDWKSAEQIANVLGKDIWLFAVAEGLRVVKNKPEYISIINNIADAI
jgi:hypothetical protein